MATVGINAVKGLSDMISFMLGTSVFEKAVGLLTCHCCVTCVLQSFGS